MSRAREIISRIAAMAAPAGPVVGRVVEASADHRYRVEYYDRDGNKVDAQDVVSLFRNGLKVVDFRPDDLVIIGFVDGNLSLPYIADRYTEDRETIRAMLRDTSTVAVPHATKYLGGATLRAFF